MQVPDTGPGPGTVNKWLLLSGQTLLLSLICGCGIEGDAAGSLLECRNTDVSI